MNGRSRRYAVAGSPVRHSLSPRIHTLFAQQTGVPLEYGLLEPDNDDFESAAGSFFSDGGSGLSVTSPYKARALNLAYELSAEARAAGAANTLARARDGRISACNTDGPGLVIDLRKRLGYEVEGGGVLVLGAGGAAAGILGAILLAKPRSVAIANRTLRRAEALAGRFAGRAEECGVQLRAVGLSDLDTGCGHNLVVQATSAPAGGDLPLDTEILAAADIVYDLRYGERAEPFLRAAKRAGAARTADGLGMLVEQAALSFAYWERVKPATEPVYEALRETHSFLPAP